MHSPFFWKIFPPPNYLVMKYTGLHICDDAVYCLEYKDHMHGRTISKYGRASIAPGVIEGGDIKDEKAFLDILSKFDKEHQLSYVKVSVPEEKAYLFQTDVPSKSVRAMAQNIESKLEQNVPLAATDSVFYFDLLPQSVTGGALRASVSVVSRTYIEHSIALLHKAGIVPMAFEVLPKSIARAIIPKDMPGAELIVHVMSQKTGIYIVSGGVVCFTSTMAWGSNSTQGQDDLSLLTKEISRIYNYWDSHSLQTSAISSIYLVGGASPRIESALRSAMADSKITVGVADIWRNIFDLDKYVPPISKEESLDYVVAAGLALI